MASDINGTVVAIQGNNVQSGTLGASQDGYVLTWTNTDGYWEAKAPLTSYGSLIITGNPMIITLSGITVIKGGWSSGESNNSTLNTTNGTITINKNCEVMISLSVGYGTSSINGNSFYQFWFYKNGSVITGAQFQTVALGVYGAAPIQTTIDYMTSAVSGDVFDCRVQGLTGSSSGYYPGFILGSFNVYSI